MPQRFAERGYHVIVQDVRGCFDSEGEFEPYFHEAGDGNATINWIAAQPWSDGAVGCGAELSRFCAVGGGFGRKSTPESDLPHHHPLPTGRLV